MDTPLFEETWQALHPRVRRRHSWDGPAQPLPPRPRKRHSIDCPTEAITLARHYDLDGDHVADHEGDYEVCDDRSRDEDGNLTNGQPAADLGPET